MTPDDAARLMDRAAARARERPEFLGWLLAQYEIMEALTANTLRDHLGVAADDWPRLQLCLRPRGDHFLADVTRIAETFGLDRGRLAAVVRRVEAVSAVSATEQSGDAGRMLAARSREPRPPEPEEPARE